MVHSRSGPAVLLTGAGGAAAVSFIKAVKGEPFVIHAADMDPYAAGLYLVPPSQRHRILPGADPHFVPHLLDLCHRHAMDVLVPTVDVELLAIATERESSSSPPVFGSSSRRKRPLRSAWTSSRSCARATERCRWATMRCSTMDLQKRVGTSRRSSNRGSAPDHAESRSCRPPRRWRRCRGTVVCWSRSTFRGTSIQLTCWRRATDGSSPPSRAPG
jgi:hypothetical protein